MAKNVKHSNETISLSIPADWSFVAYDRTITAEDIAANPATLLYLLGHGWKATIGESRALSKAEFEKLLAKAKEAGEELPTEDGIKDSRAIRRDEDVKAGKLVAGGGAARLGTYEATMRDVGLEFATAYYTEEAKKRGKVLPAKTSDDWKAMVERYVGHPKMQDKIKAEADRRMAAKAVLEELELDF